METDRNELLRIDSQQKYKFLKILKIRENFVNRKFFKKCEKISPADSQQMASISIGFGLSESLSLPEVDDVELSRDAAREPFGDVTDFVVIG